MVNTDSLIYTTSSQTITTNIFLEYKCFIETNRFPGGEFENKFTD